MELTTQLEQAVSGGFGPREKKDPKQSFFNQF